MDRALQAGRRVSADVAAIAAIAAAAALAGCAQVGPFASNLNTQVRSGAHDVMEATRIQPLGVDPSSPVAADVTRAEAIRGPVPSFASVPPKPTDIPAATAYKTQVVGLVGERRSLVQWEKANPPGVTDTEGFAEAQRARVGKETPVTDQRTKEAEAFAEKARKAAQEPPPRTPSPN